MEKILTTTQLIVRACQDSGLSFTSISADQEVIKIHFPKFDQLVVSSNLGLISATQAQLCLDKGYQEELLRGVVNIPKTKTFIDPRSKFADPSTSPSILKITTEIAQNFALPVIIKKSHGLQGQATFLCHNPEEITKAVTAIFSHQNWEYDHVLLAQQYVKPLAEYRAVFYQHQLEILYLKDISQATFVGNLSPLHYLGAKAVDCEDRVLRTKVQNFVDPVFSQFDLVFAGFDLIVDENNQWWLIEINSAPGFTYYARDNSPQKVVKLFSKIFRDLQHEQQPLANL